ncbi:Gfo/Idh/MocA family oxidoreductase [Rhodococcus sp. IEGM 1381]|uniref:Gfo/Idh/MocA family protein n=1 Tax=Rhodococcus sp. IEGM 1381 TaxID=3047085 RepID=UPI0024B79C29|nr:Gfo/Idh/MocA family oxidoreductase [Rhodococcus sp. IEGM 1381]MDI9894546.1 Gfo/Idh/MocA family oxidoreductase [Rhodococcus sp. IEGM 1381]
MTASTKALILPSSRVPAPSDAPPLRWGILGPGWIAERFVEALRTCTSQHISAVASRNSQRGTRFASDWKIPAVYNSYDDLVAAPDVDVVYIATPHTAHFEHATLALNAGKHVVVEKPLALDADQGRAIAELAQAKGLFAMEALWSAFLPKFDVIEQILADGVLGDIGTVLADHGEHFDTDHRIYDPALAGGPLLDLGTYTVYFAQRALGKPVSVTAVGQQANPELNGQISAILQSPTGAHAVVNTTILADTPSRGTLSGTAGMLCTDGVFYRPGDFTVSLRDGRTARFVDEISGYPAGLAFEAAEAARRITGGELESPCHTLNDAISTLHTLDEIRRQLGIEFRA